MASQFEPRSETVFPGVHGVGLPMRYTFLQLCRAQEGCPLDFPVGNHILQTAVSGTIPPKFREFSLLPSTAAPFLEKLLTF